MAINKMFDSEEMVIAHIRENDVDLDERVVSSTTTNFKFVETLAHLGYVEAFKVIYSIKKYNKYDLNRCLWHAVRKGKIDLVRYLVELPNKRVDIFRDNCSSTRKAKREGHDDIVEYLESLGAVAEEEIIPVAKTVQFFEETASELSSSGVLKTCSGNDSFGPALPIKSEPLSPEKLKKWSKGDDYESRLLEDVQPIQQADIELTKQTTSQSQSTRSIQSLVDESKRIYAEMRAEEDAKQTALVDVEIPKYSGLVPMPERGMHAMKSVCDTPSIRWQYDHIKREIEKNHPECSILGLLRKSTINEPIVKPNSPMDHPHGRDGKFDESTIPPRMLKMALAVHNFRSYGITVTRSPFHRNKVMFVNFPQNPCCTRCENGLVVNTETGCINHVYRGYCDKCNLQWNVVHVKGDDIVERYVNRGQY